MSEDPKGTMIHKSASAREGTAIYYGCVRRIPQAETVAEMETGAPSAVLNPKRLPLWLQPIMEGKAPLPIGGAIPVSFSEIPIELIEFWDADTREFVSVFRVPYEKGPQNGETNQQG